MKTITLLIVFIIFLILLYSIIHLFIGDQILLWSKENFEVDNDNYYGLVDCENYPYLCKLDYPIENNDYIYNRALSKEKLVKLEKYYNRFLKRKERKN
jgi:hypothetical protein